MTVTPVEASLERFEGLIAEQQDAREWLWRFDGSQYDDTEIGKRERDLAYAKISQAQEEATTTLVAALRDTPGLTDAERAITLKAFDVGRGAREDNLRDNAITGLETFGRVREEARKNVGALAYLTDHSITIVNASGDDDFRFVPVRHKPGHAAINLAFDGMEARVTRIDDRFPDKGQKTAVKVEGVLPSDHGNRPGPLMAPFDPLSERFKLPFIRLGTADQPGEDLNAHIDERYEGSGVARYAARLVVKAMGHQEWLVVDPPGEVIRDRVVSAFADAYAALLMGDLPPDVRPNIRVYESNGAACRVSGSVDRLESVAKLSAPERRLRLFAAGAYTDQVEEATRERIATIGESDQPLDIARSLRAAPILEAFFSRLRQQDSMTT